MVELSDDKLKQAIKEAIKEWLDEKYLAFGKFSFGALCASGLATIIYFILTTQGWHK